MLTIPSISTRSTMLGLRAQSIACAASSHSGCWRSGLIKTRSVATATAKSPRRRQNLIGRYGPSCQIIHHYSTDSASLDSSPTSSPPPPSTSLTWNDYLALRRSRRNYNLVASVATCAGSTASGVLLVNNYFELIGTYITLDPFFIIIIGTVASAGIGWLSGPILGNFVFRMFHRRVTGEMAEKERDFYARIRKYRVDPSTQSMSNPVPDYYGEKIGSVADFRTWMKDQRAFNKKRQTF